MFPVEFVMEVVVLKLFPCKREWFAKIFCLPINSWESKRRPNSSQKCSLSIFTALLQLFAPRKTGVGNQMMTSFAERPKKHLFFNRISSLISWFIQGVRFSLPAANLNRFCPQFSIADEIIAV